LEKSSREYLSIGTYTWVMHILCVDVHLISPAFPHPCPARIQTYGVPLEQPNWQERRARRLTVLAIEFIAACARQLYAKGKSDAKKSVFQLKTDAL